MQPEQTTDRAWHDEVFTLRGDDRVALVAEVERLSAALSHAPQFRLKDLARRLNEDLAPGGERLAVVARDSADLANKLDRAVARLKDPRCARIKDRRGIYFFERPDGLQGGLAFLFPGEGAQYQNMLADLALHFREAREPFDLADMAFAGHARARRPSELIFPPATQPQADGTGLFEMDAAATAVFAANQAMFRLLTSLGVRADAVVGHSTGEYSALCAAGVLRFRDDAELIAKIVELNGIYERSRGGDIPDGMLLGVGGIPADTILAAVEAVGGSLHVAIRNCPNQLVLFGSREDIEALTARLDQCGGVFMPLPFGRAYHTPLFAGFAERLRPFFDALDLAPPAVELWSCATAAPFPRGRDGIRDLALAQWTRPVRFQETIEAMHGAGIRIFVEVGPRGNLAAFVQDILCGRPFLAVPSNLPHRSGIQQLCHLLALLSAHRQELAFDRLYAGRTGRSIPLDELLGRSGRRAGIRLQLALGLPTLSLPPSATRTGAATTGPTPIASDAGPEPSPPAAARQRNDWAAARSRPGGMALQAVAARSVAVARQPSGRAAAMAGYQRTMDRFLRLQEAVVTSAVARTRVTKVVACEAGNGNHGKASPRGSPAGYAVPPPPGEFRLLGEILSLAPGREIVAERRFSLREDHFLRDHVLGGQVSARDRDLLPLAIMPLTMSIELMAEAASLLLPGLRVVGLRSVRAWRWIAFEQDELVVRVQASRGNAEPRNVEVLLFVVRDSGEQADGPAAEGVVQLAACYPPVPPAGETAHASGAAPAALDTDSLYARAMFNGPRLRSVRSLDCVGPDSAEAILEALPGGDLFAGGPTPEFLTDPVVLDGAGQVVGFWTAERLTRRFVVFPVSLEELAIYGPPLAPGTQARCRAHITLRGESDVVSTIDVIAPSGRLHASLRGWADRRFDLTRTASAFVLSPAGRLLTSAWPEHVVPAMERLGLAGRLADASCDDLAPFDTPVWQEALARLILGRAEREVWRGLANNPTAIRRKRAWEWLLGRLAAKDAVRDWVRRRGGPDLLPADIEIGTDPSGRPTISSPVPGVSAVPVLSISHCGSPAAAVALVGDGAVLNGVGVDIEPVRRLDPAFAEAAFDSDERALLAALPSEGEWVLRGWAAKEAAAKAAGINGPEGPLTWCVRGMNHANGTIRVTRRGGGPELQADSALRNGMVLAVMVLAKGAMDGRDDPSIATPRRAAMSEAGA